MNNTLFKVSIVSACVALGVGCSSDGEDGENGNNGLNSLVLQTSLSIGNDNCPNGGTRIDSGIDTNSNGVLDVDEITSTSYNCNSVASQLIQLEQIGRFADDLTPFDESAAEIVAYDSDTQKLFVVNANIGAVDILDLSDPTTPVKSGSLTASENWPEAGEVNSVAVANGIILLAVANDDDMASGKVQAYRATDNSFLSQADVGVLPDNVVFAPNGTTALVANEGEPADDYSQDPEGSVSIVDVSNPESITVTQVSFTDFNIGGERHDELPESLRIFGNKNRTALSVSGFTDTDPAQLTVSDASTVMAGHWFTLASEEGDPIPYQVASVSGNTITLTTDFDGDSEVDSSGTDGLTVYLHDGQSSVAEDLEPEYIAVAPNGEKAWVTLQENNAVAIIDIASASVDAIVNLGVKNHNLPGNGLDASDKDDAINIQNHNLYGMYMPDTIASFEQAGATFYVTANEGDAREYDGYVEEIKFGQASFEVGVVPDTSPFSDNNLLGRLRTSLANDTDGDGDLDLAHAYGARSFSIWSQDGSLVFDSGDDFEVKTAEYLGLNFNNDNDENDGDSRSDNKGPEPEALTVATFNGHHYAFIGLERVGGIMVYEITNPASPVFMQYINNRNFSYDMSLIEDGIEPAHAAGDLGPEGMTVISASDSPTGKPLLVVANEVSGTTTIYQISIDQ
ncbi:choice-of-anchor I family protein [Pleionea sediminis]|uniref:choice-of-anchor I family protein n=1 Tax=Pleionea sediminis TaxID=2569479 RepID=UPI001185983A|nr:choice-of-anchor I family protein [Pleionea sediminis]